MRKTKTQISFAMTAWPISALVFSTRIVQSLFFYLNPKPQAPSHLVWLNNSVCVGSGREPGRPVFLQQSPYVTYHETKTAKTDGRTWERLDWNFLIFMYEQPRPVGAVWGIDIYAMLNIDNAKSKNLHTPL